MHRKVPFTLFLLVAILASMVPAGLVRAQGPVVNPTGPVTTISAPPPDKGAAPAGNPEPLAPGIDAVASYYNFSSFLGTYSEISGGTLVTTSCDDNSYNNQPIGFTFIYDAVAYTVFSIQCNGFIAMGPSVSSSYAPISSGTTNNVISALGGDLQTNATNSEIRYQVLGSSPNQVLVVQYKNFRPYAGTGYIYNFQIRLYETSNIVEVVYGEFTSPSTYTRQVGLRGASNADYNNRMTDATHFWENSLPGTANSSTMTLGPGYLPTSGLTYDWIHTPSPAFDTSTKVASVSQIVTGGWFNYTITINNTGDQAANGTMMTDTLPLEVAYRAGSLSCPGATCSYDPGTHRIFWTGDVAIGGSATVYFEVDATGCGTAVNSAWIKHPSSGKQVTRTATTAIVSILPDFLEGFEDSVPPPGWTETIVDDPGTDPDWTRESVGTYPTINPHGGSYMAKFNSFNASSGASARLWSYALDLSGYLAPTVVFWMSHDTGYASNADRIQVQVSTDGVNWVNVGAPVLRYDAAFTTPGWKEHVVVLPAGYNINGVYLGFLGISAYGNNFYLDDVSLAESWYPCPVATLRPNQAGMGCRASDVTYNLVAGTNYMTDTYDLWPTGNAWPTTPDPTSLVLGPGDTGPVSVTVHVPWDAPLGSTDVATVHLGGQTYGLEATANLATTAADGFMADQWQNMATGSPTPLYWGASYYDSGLVCFVGGLTGPTGSIIVSGAHQCYDIATATWINRASMPTPLFGTAYGLIGNKFYMAGGFDINFVGYTSLQIYDIATDSWSTGAPLPSARGGQAGGVVNGKLYSAGGSGTSSFPTDCPTYEYDPLLDTWTTLASCPLQGGYGFDLGGSVGSSYYGRLYAGGHFGSYYGWYAFDPVANSWTTLANLPGGVHKTPLFVERPDTGQILMIGGMVGWAGQTGVWEYNVAGNSWDPAPPDIITAQGGSLGPAQGSFADPSTKGFWTFGGTIGSGSITPPPFEYLAFVECPPVVPDIVVTPDALSAEQCPDEVTTQTLTICNNGIAPLNWSISELSETLALGEIVRPMPPARPSITLPAGAPQSLNEYIAAGRPAFTVQPAAPTPPVAVPEALTFYTSRVDFDADFPGLPVEGYENGSMASGTVDAVPHPLDQYSSNAYFDPGDILPGIQFWATASHSADEIAVLGEQFMNNPSKTGVANYFTDGYIVFFDPPVQAVGLDLQDFVGSYSCQVDIYDTVGYLTSVTAACNEAGVFWGVASDANPIVQLVITDLGGGAEGADNVAFGNAPAYDVPWLSENPISGQTWMGECSDVVVSFDSTGMAPGTYTAGLLIESDDPDTPTVTVPVEMIVQTPAEIEVTPVELWSVLCPDTTEAQALQICNLGECDLEWTLHEMTPTLTLRSTPFVPVNVAGKGINPGLTAASPSAKLVAVPSGPEDVLWDQPLSAVNQNAYVDQEFTDYPAYSSFLADDFTNADPWVIESIFVPGNGWNGFTSILNATALTWQIYADCAGVPCGDPSGGGNPPVWTLTLPPNDPQVVVTNGSGGMPSNVQLNLATPGVLPPGTWWFIFYPTAPFSGFGQYGRQPADTTNGYTGQFINPGGGFGFGTTWQPWSIIGATQQDMAFRIEGTVQTIVYPDFPWIGEDPVQGILPAGECQTVTVTFDATGLTPGDYLADIVIVSNDADEPETIVPTTLTVLEPVSIVDVAYGIADLTVAFTPTVAGTEPIDYWWDFGDGGTSTETNPVYTYAEGGCYTVALDVENACGADSWTGEVCVCASVSDADFTWYPLAPLINETVYFTGTAAGTGPIAYEWDFGDGTTGTGENVSHAYATANTYTVIMTATGQCGFQVVTYDITVYEGCVPPYGADFTWAPTSPVMGEVVHFTGTIAGGSGTPTYAWNFGDGDTGSGATPIHVYAAAGTYTVRMTVTNDCGYATATYDIVVVEGCVAPTDADFTWLPLSPSAGQVVAFTGSTVGGTPPFTFAWSFGDGGSGTGNPINHTYALSGTYTVVMTVTNACGEAYATHEVVVSAVGPTYYRLYLPIIVKTGVK